MKQPLSPEMYEYVVTAVRRGREKAYRRKNPPPKHDLSWHRRAEHMPIALPAPQLDYIRQRSQEGQHDLQQGWEVSLRL